MGKRKAAAPKRTMGKMRAQLSWNMLEELRPPGSLTLIENTDPSLQIEATDAQKALEAEVSSKRLKNGTVCTQNVTEETFLNGNLKQNFNLYLEECMFYIKVHNELDLKNKEWNCCLGNFTLTFLEGTSLLEPPPEGVLPVGEYWIYVSEDPSKCMLYCESCVRSEDNSIETHLTNKTEYYWVVKIDLPLSVLESLQTVKIFQIMLENTNLVNETLALKIYCREASLSKFVFPSEPIKPKKQCKAIQEVVGELYNIRIPSYRGLDYVKKHDIDTLYREVKTRHSKYSGNELVNIRDSGLIPILRPYQKEAVCWMLHQESGDINSRKVPESLHCLYEKICTPDDQALYYHKYGGCLILDKPHTLSRPLGGILADEMGLGKTVVFLACMLVHVRPMKDMPLPERLPTVNHKEESMDWKECPTKSRNRKSSQASNIVEQKEVSKALRLPSFQSESSTIVSHSKNTELSLSHRNNQATSHKTNRWDSHNVLRGEIKCVTSGQELDRAYVNASIVDHCYTDRTIGNVLKATRKEEELKLSISETQPASVVSNSLYENENVIGEAEPKGHLMLGSQESDFEDAHYNELHKIEKILQIAEPEQKLMEVSSETGFVKVSVADTVADGPKVTSKELLQAASGTNSTKVAFDNKNNADSVFEEETLQLESEQEISEKEPVKVIFEVKEFSGFDDQGPEFRSYDDHQTDLSLESNSFNDIFNEQKLSTSLKKSDTIGQNDNDLNSIVQNDVFNIPENFPNSPNVAFTGIEFAENEQLQNDKMITHNFTEIVNSSKLSTLPGRVNIVEKHMKNVSNCGNNDISEHEGIQSTRSENTALAIEFAENNGGADVYTFAGLEVTSSINCISAEHRNQPVLCIGEAKDSELMQVNIKPKYSIFDQPIVSQKQFFECVCGSKETGKKNKSKENKHQVQCSKCGVWQHAECLNYDLLDPYRGLYLCPHCHVQSDAVPSGATLIISPSTICYQWVEEIAKHIKKDSLKVFVYTGVNKMGFIQPRTLAKQNIVITAYETLRKELDYVDLPHINSEAGRRFRHPKRFMAKTSPIIAVEWWRICLDEAQMVEGTTTKTAEMALRLKAVNRWCVTGTPIQRGIEDLYGLFLFLGVDPYWVHQWWKQLLYDPFCYGVRCPLYDVLSTVLWRTAKKDVLDQINIPEQTEKIHWLTFSPIEEHFYRRQYQECGKEALQKLSKWNNSNTKLSSLDKFTMSQLLHPLLRLRQACCHPQAVRGEFLPIHKSTMTMEELLECLTKKAKLECEEAHRQLVAAINGIAGLHIIQEQYIEAVDHYRQVLRSVNEHGEMLRTDDLQQLHAMHNLQEILTLKPPGIDPTLRDDMLQQQAEELRRRYLTKAANFVSVSLDGLKQSRQTADDLRIAIQEGFEWWLDLIQWSMDRYLDSDMVDKIREDICENASPELNSITYRFRDARGLELVLHSQLMALDSAYQKLKITLDKLNDRPSPDLVSSTVECCLRPVGNILKSCPFCKADELFNEFESRLFSFVDRGIVVGFDEEDPQYQVHTRRQGTWADSELEKALKSILSFSRSFKADEETLEYGNIHIKLFEAMKKEFKNMRKLFMALKENAQTFDELDMATTRLRARLVDEPVPEIPQPNILEPNQLNEHKLKLLSDRIIADNHLKKKLGQLLYLKNLAKTQFGVEGSNPDPCPICQRALGVKWSVLQCGHCFCLDCVKVLVNQYSSGGRHRSVKCAICRQTTYHGEISYVCTGRKSLIGDEDQNITVKGSHSTKVEAVVRCLMAIRKKEPRSKALVFSTWIDVLNVVAVALEENGIGLKKLYAGGKFQANLSAFKEEAGVTALLLPILSGANGLNIIEATHVLLVEPILNPGQELQAIGRVHRIGQIHCTQIHRFLVRATIEQKMYNMWKNVNTDSVCNSPEENILTIGDLAALFHEEREGERDETGQHGHDMGSLHQVSLQTINSPNVSLIQSQNQPSTSAQTRGSQHEVSGDTIVTSPTITGSQREGGGDEISVRQLKMLDEESIVLMDHSRDVSADSAVTPASLITNVCGCQSVNLSSNGEATHLSDIQENNLCGLHGLIQENVNLAVTENQESHQVMEYELVFSSAHNSFMPITERPEDFSAPVADNLESCHLSDIASGYIENQSEANIDMKEEICPSSAENSNNYISSASQDTNVQDAH